MRTINQNFTGFICGQYHSRETHETYEGVMFYEAGQPQTLFVPYTTKDLSKLCKALKRMESDVAADLTKKVVRHS